MQIVGVSRAADEGLQVHTIDVWYSDRRQVWVVERLDADGHQVGLGHVCRTEEDAESCLQEWLRAHRGVHLVAPRLTTEAERRLLRHSRSQAA